MTERTQALAALEQGCNFCMEMTGDSMAPKILDGDVVFLQPVTTWTAARSLPCAWTGRSFSAGCSGWGNG